MLFLVLLIYVAHACVVRRSPERLVLVLIPAFSVSQLPSALKESLVAEMAGSYVYPQDVILLGLLALLLLDVRSRSATANRLQLPALLACYVALNLILLAHAVVSAGFDPAYVRQTLFGTLWLALAVARLDLTELQRNGLLGKSLMAHNLIVLISATLVALRPDLNDPDSELASFLGFTATEGEGGSLILVSAISAVMCLISVWYFLFEERRDLLSPAVALPIGLVVVSAHRIDYLALALLLALYFLRRERPPRRIRPTWLTCLLVGLYGVAVVQVVRIIGADVIVELIVPFVERATSLFEGTQTGTVDDRLQQYAHFFQSYLSSHEPLRYILGEGYLPVSERDAFYQYVQPHNFLINLFVNNGLLGVIFFGAFLGPVVLARRSSPFLVPLGLLMVTQLTDAGFPVYPNAAYVALLVALMQAGVGVRCRILRAADPGGPAQSGNRVLSGGT